MKIIDRIILTLYTFCLALASILLIIFPFNRIKVLSIEAIMPYLESIKGNYWFSIVGLAFLLVSLRFLISGIKRGPKVNYITRYTNLGELKISTQTIEGLAQSVTANIEGLKDIKTSVDLSEEKIVVKINGYVNTDINIPETTAGVQSKVKDHIEKCTGVEVHEVNVEIHNVSAPMKSIK